MLAWVEQSSKPLVTAGADEKDNPLEVGQSCCKCPPKVESRGCLFPECPHSEGITQCTAPGITD